MAGYTQSTAGKAIEDSLDSDRETTLDAAVAIAVEDFLAKLRRGQQPAVEDHASRYPLAADELRRVLPTLELLEAAKSRAPSSPERRSASVSLERLGDFRVVREIGRGGMGIVYEAVQESLGRRVALKVLAPHSLLDVKTVRRFQREARSAAQLHHTNIVPVFGVGEEQGRHYYVMQFIPGQGLDGVIRGLRGELDTRFAHDLGAESHGVDPSEAAPSPELQSTANLLDVHTTASASFGAANTPRHWRNVARVACEIANALAHAHAQGTLHRDIKPSNILLDAEGTAWISDFGLAKAVDDEDLTTTGEVLGTLRYAPPEALHGKYDARSDVFGLGLSLYEFCALRPARDASRREHLVRQVTQETPPRLERVRPEIPRDLQTIVHKAIDLDPTRRYQRISDLADDLRRFANDEPIRARRSGRIERAWRWCRRNPALSIVTAAAVLVVGVTTCVAFWNVRSARDDAVQAFFNEQAERRNATASARAAQSSLRLANEANAKVAAALAAEKVQLKLAQELTAEARENLTFARAAVARYLTVIGDSPTLKAKGLDSLRRALLENAREFYDQLADRRGDDLELQCDRSNGYLRLGQLMQDVGQVREGLELMDTAQGILKPLHERSPADRRILERLLECYEAQSRVLQRIGDLSAAEKKMTSALELAQRLADLHPDEFLIRFRLAKTYELYGVCISRGKDVDRIIAAYEKSLKLYRGLLAQKPGHFELRRETSETLANLGIVYQRARRLADAEEALDEALAILNTLAEESPEHVRTLGGLALVHGNLAGIYRDTDRKEQAIEVCRAAIARFTKLAERRGEIIFYQEYLALNLSRLAELLSANETHQEADAAYARAIETRRGVFNKTSLASHRLELVSALMDRAKALIATAQPAPALPLIDECVALVARLEAGERKALLSPLADAGFALHRGKALLAIGRSDEAREALRDAVSRAEKVLADRPTDERAVAFTEECRMTLASAESASTSATDRSMLD